MLCSADCNWCLISPVTAWKSLCQGTSCEGCTDQRQCYVTFSFSLHLVLTKLMLMCNDNITEYYCVMSSLPHPLEPWQSLVCSSSTHAQTEAAWSNYKIITDRPAQRTLMQLLPFPSSVLRCDALYFRQFGATVQYYFKHELIVSVSYPYFRHSIEKTIEDVQIGQGSTAAATADSPSSNRWHNIIIRMSMVENALRLPRLWR